MFDLIKEVLVSLSKNHIVITVFFIFIWRLVEFAIKKTPTKKDDIGLAKIKSLIGYVFYFIENSSKVKGNKKLVEAIELFDKTYLKYNNGIIADDSIIDFAKSEFSRLALKDKTFKNELIKVVKDVAKKKDI